MEAAEYSLTDSKHSGLGLESYCHFTSPIRRMADTILHWNIKNNQTIMTDDLLNILNQKEKQIKQYHYQQSILEILDIIESEYVTNGTIIDFNNEGRIELYFEEWNKFLKTYLFIPSMRINVDIELEDNCLKIKNLISNKVILLNIGQKIQVKLFKRSNLLPLHRLIIKCQIESNKWFTL